jgi:Ca2+-binding EF-hand superfamily protein
MSGASARMAPANKMANLFKQISTPGSNAVTQAQFNTAFSTMNPSPGFQQAGANAVFSALDPKGTGSVSRQDFIQGMTKMMSQFNSSANS